MFPAQVDYRRAESLDEAIDLLADRDGRDVRPLAGGHGIVPDMKAGEASPEVLVDVSGIDGLDGIEAVDVTEEADDGTADADDKTDDKAAGGAVTVGALATHADLASSELLDDRAPVLASAARDVADVQIRNRGTIGGNLAEADPAADLPAAVLAADATVRVRGPDGERAVPADEFFRGPGETALADDELVTAVEIPPHQSGTYVKKTHPATGYAMVGVAAVAAVDAGTVSAVRVAANGVMDRAVRLRAVERALTGADVGSDPGPVLADAAASAAGSLEPDRQIGDAHASAEFRAEVLETYVERALAAAVDGAIDGDVDGDAPGGDEA